MALAIAKAGNFLMLLVLMMVTAVGGMVVREFWPDWAEEHGLNEDNAVEEYVEDLVESQTGLDVDLTPYSPETIPDSIKPRKKR